MNSHRFIAVTARFRIVVVTGTSIVVTREFRGLVVRHRQYVSARGRDVLDRDALVLGEGGIEEQDGSSISRETRA